jgi:inhibitor of cysteine peptidase
MGEWMMGQQNRVNGRLKGVIAIAFIGFVLNFSSMGAVRAARAQVEGTQTSAAGFSWEYQLDFSDSSTTSASQQASNLTPILNDQGVASEMQSVGDSNYRLTMTGSQGIEQVRQVLYSPLIASFIGGAAEIEIKMPVSNMQDITFKLESNLTTGYSWEIVPTGSDDFTQVDLPTFTAESSGYGVPSVQTLVLQLKTAGEGKINLVYRRLFKPDETVTRHLRITLAAQVTEIDLSDPHPKVISSQTGSSGSPNPSNPIAEIPLKGDLPASLDWRPAGIVPAPRDQGACGGCWSFGTVGIMESAIAKAGGPLTDLSEQFLISCNTDGWNCIGGLTANKYHYNKLGQNQTNIGAVLEVDKPYTATKGICNMPYNHPFTLSGWQFIVPNEWTMPTVDQIKNAIYTYGPVTAGVCVGPSFQAYASGTIFSTDETSLCPGSTFRTNHQIILVGWNDAGGYWILRNSWGPTWGESGYMRIAYNTSRVGEGTSWVIWSGGLLNRVYLPLVLRDFAGILPSDFQKSAPANSATGQLTNPTLSWEASSSATNYDYCIDTINNNACDATWTSTAANTSVGLSDLTPAASYYWQVRAVNISGTTYADSGTWWTFNTAPLSPGGGIINGNFESGSTGWIEYSLQGWPVIVSNSVLPITPHNGIYAAWLGGTPDEISYVQQQVTIASSTPYLVYWHWIASEDICDYDIAVVLINGLVVDIYTLCNTTNTGGWVTHSVNLSAYTGQSVTLQIRIETDSSINSNLFIDDVSLQSSASALGQIHGVLPNLEASITQGKNGIIAQEKKPQSVGEKRLLKPR